MIWRIRDRATFAALARAKVVSDRGVRVRLVVSDEDPRPARVACAPDRGLGNAVARNRVRRRLRAAVAAVTDEFEPGDRVLVTGGRDVAQLPFPELRGSVRQAVRRARKAAA